MNERVRRIISSFFGLALMGGLLFTGAVANATPKLIITQSSAAASATEHDTEPCVSPVEYFTAAAHFTTDWSRERFNELFDAPGRRDPKISFSVDGKLLTFYSWKICNYTRKDAVLAIGWDGNHKVGLMDFERNRGFEWKNARERN